MLKEFCTSCGRTYWKVIILVLLFSVPEAQAQYAHNMGGPSFDWGVEVDVDASGNAYFIGNFSDTLDFDPGPDTYYLDNNNSDVFVASYDSAGTMRFAFRISGFLASNESAGDIAVAPDGSFVITGSQPFGGIDFDPDPISERVRSGELYVAGYTSEGEVRFAVSAPGGQNTSSGKGHAVTLDSEGNVYATGAFMTSLDFNPADTSSGVVPYRGSNDAFLASYTATGEYRYAFSFGGDGYDYGSGIAVDSEGNVYVTGMFSGEVNFDPNDVDNDGDLQQRTSENNIDFYLVSYGPDGRFRFVYTYKGSTGVDTEREFALSIDGKDNVYLSGESHDKVYFDPEDADGDGDRVERTAEPLGSAFLASYTSSGILRFATVLKGGGSVSTDVFASDDGTSFITGTFSGDVDFDPDRPNVVLSSRRGSDVFVASYDSTGAYRLAYNLPSTGLSTGEGIAADADYNVVLTGGFTIDLDVDQGSTEDMRSSTGQNDIFMARYKAGGPTSVDIEDHSAPRSRFEVAPPYPNPFTATVHFRLEMDDPKPVRIEVYDLLGRMVSIVHDGSIGPGAQVFSWDGSGERNGLYFIRIDDGTRVEVLRATLIR